MQATSTFNAVTSIDARAGELMTIPLTLLVPSKKRNVRRTGSTSVADLKASIEAQGLLHNLIVCPVDPELDEKAKGKGKRDAKGTKGTKGKASQCYEVVGGGRRFRALVELAAEHRIRKDEEILCRVKPTREAAEASLAENYHREPMHPADEFEAFQRLVQDGASIEEIAQRFGTSPLTVRRRLKLADVHPELRQLYRDNGIAMEQLMALALCDDPEQQLAAWNAAPTWCRDAHSLRSALVSEEVDATSDALAKFIGIDAYEAAGGRVRRDLFSDEGEGYLQDTAMLDRLASERLEAVAEEVRSEGWRWVEVVLRASTLELYKFGRAPKGKRSMTRKEAKARKALESRIEELERILDNASNDDGGDADDAEETMGSVGDKANKATDADESSVDSVDGARDAGRIEQEYEEARALLRALDDSLFTFEESVRTRSGTIVCVGRDGKLQIHRGLTRPGERKGSVGSEEPGEDHDGGEGDDGCDGVGDGTKHRGRPVHSAVLMRELTAHRTLAARAALLDRPDVALTALLHCLVQRLLIDASVRDQSPVRLVCNSPEAGLVPEAGSTLGEARATAMLADARLCWGDRIPGEPQRIVPWLATLPEGERMELLALCIALSINDVHADERPDALDPLCLQLGLDMADWWAASRTTYFERVTKDVIVAAITEAAGSEVAARYKGVSKGELARVAERDLVGLHWLPAPLRAPSNEAGA